MGACTERLRYKTETKARSIVVLDSQFLGLIATRAFTSEAFDRHYDENHVQLSKFQRFALSAGASVLSLSDPFRADMIACLGETTGEIALARCLVQLRSSDEGRSLLQEKPRIDTRTLDLLKLAQLEPGTLGRTYHDFLTANKVSPDSRDDVRFVDDRELAYVMQRYREVHDIFHAVLLMPTTMLGEVSVKWVEALQTRLPMCVAGAIFGAIRLRPRQRQLYVKYHMPWAIDTARNARFLLGVYFEKRWDQTLEDFHREMKISPLAR